ncbi:MAG: enoyl-CoA hydratase/isomerase family protein [Balneolaceae bacterium]|nr:enoyl-CoA hydratase/isomerase family protein [Balneolaceae bacterium]
MKSYRKIRKVAVLGSGVMGSQIAAHCINAGLEVLLLDLKSDDSNRPNKIAEESVKKLIKMKPAPLADSSMASLIKTGNFEDDLEALVNYDWICEVVVERMDIKQELLSKIDGVRSSTSIVSSNTSGLPIEEISQKCSNEFKAHFLGTHFFNPPRYMHLLELIPIAETAEETLETMRLFFDEVLGKGVVKCKDTPNFIANRIGVYSMASLLPYFFNGDFRAEEIDALCGTLTGYSKAASFRTADLAGLDVLHHVAKNIYPAIPNDEQREVFKLPEGFSKMVENGWNGNKAGQGFYKKVQTKNGREFHVLNPDSFEYELQEKPNFEIIKEAKKISNSADRLKYLVQSDSKEGQFLWEVQRNLLLYAANRIPEISDSIEAVDRAMKWGFNWELGPFERWDALGIKYVADRASEDGFEVPSIIQSMVDAGVDKFYQGENVYNPLHKSFDEATLRSYKDIPRSKAVNQERVVVSSGSSAVIDLGDGIAQFEFRTKNSTLNAELVQDLEACLKRVEEDFDGLVISHWGDNFALGADLMEAITHYRNSEMDKVYDTVNNFQRTAVSLRYAPFPVIAAPFGMTLGGGAEFVMYSDKVVAHHELYMGLVEVGVGLIPAGGGTTELLRRAMRNLPEDADPLPFIRNAFKTIGLAKVSDSAVKAKQLGLIPDDSVIVMNRNNQLEVAKQVALSLVEAGYVPPAKPIFNVLGKKAESVMKIMLYVMNESGYATDYDKVVAERVAKVLAGGSLSEPQSVSEDYMLKLEREAIFECLNDERTHARIEHMLKTGKPLRN